VGSPITRERTTTANRAMSVPKTILINVFIV
jgi:hypothetical protein